MFNHNGTRHTYAILLNSCLPHPKQDQTDVGRVITLSHDFSSVLIVSLILRKLTNKRDDQTDNPSRRY